MCNCRNPFCFFIYKTFPFIKKNNQAAFKKSSELTRFVFSQFLLIRPLQIKPLCYLVAVEPPLALWASNVHVGAGLGWKLLHFVLYCLSGSLMCSFRARLNRTNTLFSDLLYPVGFFQNFRRGTLTLSSLRASRVILCLQ